LSSLAIAGETRSPFFKCQYVVYHFSRQLQNYWNCKLSWRPITSLSVSMAMFSLASVYNCLSSKFTFV